MKKSRLFGLAFTIAAAVAMADEPPAAPPAPAQHRSLQEVRAACKEDVQKLCTGVQPGGGRIVGCLKQHKEEVSDGCKQAIQKAKPNTA